MSHRRPRHEAQLDAVGLVFIGLVAAVAAIIAWLYRAFAPERAQIDPPMPQATSPPEPTPKPPEPRIAPRARGGRLQFDSEDELNAWLRQNHRERT